MYNHNDDHDNNNNDNNNNNTCSNIAHSFFSVGKLFRYCLAPLAVVMRVHLQAAERPADALDAFVWSQSFGRRPGTLGDKP